MTPRVVVSTGSALLAAQDPSFFHLDFLAAHGETAKGLSNRRPCTWWKCFFERSNHSVHHCNKVGVVLRSEITTQLFSLSLSLSFHCRFPFPFCLANTIGRGFAHSLLKLVSSITRSTLVKTTGAQLFSLRHPSLLINVRRALGHSIWLLSRIAFPVSNRCRKEKVQECLSRNQR